MTLLIREAFKRYQQEYPATARLDYYLKAAQARKAMATDEESNTIRDLERNVEIALQALSDGDIDHFAQQFERVIRRTVELNLPEHDKVMERVKQASAGEGNKGKTKDFAKMLKRICEQIGSTETPDVLKHWQRFDNQDEAEENPRPHVWAVNNGSLFDYWYADERDLEQPASIEKIRMAMTRLRKRETAPK